MSTCDFAAKLLGKVSVDIWDLRNLAALRSEDSREERMSSLDLVDLFLLDDIILYCI